MNPLGSRYFIILQLLSCWWMNAKREGNSPETHLPLKFGMKRKKEKKIPTSKPEWHHKKKVNVEGRGKSQRQVPIFDFKSQAQKVLKSG